MCRRYGLHFLVGGGCMGICVQQPWQSISLWSVADKFRSTFSFFLICGSSLSLSHAENEVSRFETALQPTCQISLFCLPIRFMVDSLLPPGSEEIHAFLVLRSLLDVKPFAFHSSPHKTLHPETKGSLFFFFGVCQSSFPTAMTTFRLCWCYNQPDSALYVWLEERQMMLAFASGSPIVQMFPYRSGRYSELMSVF